MHKIRNFHEGHSTVGEWQGSGMVAAGERHGMCESVFNTAGVRQGMCESAFRGGYLLLLDFVIIHSDYVCGERVFLRMNYYEDLHI
jgi:hypothetical protein